MAVATQPPPGHPLHDAPRSPAANTMVLRCAITVVALLTTAPCLSAPLDLVMERLDVHQEQGRSLTQIHFNPVVTVASRCPSAPGMSCEVELQLHGDRPGATAADTTETNTPEVDTTPDIHESRTPPQPAAYPLSRIDYYQHSERRGRLVLHFEVPVTLSVVSEADGHTLTIGYESPSLAEATPAAAPAALPMAPATPLKIITLKESPREINPKAEKTVLPAMRYDMYTSTAHGAGKTRYQLHLGFFTSEEAATKALQAVRADYPQAIIEDLPPADRQRAERWIRRRKQVLSRRELPAARDRNARLMERARQALIAGDHQTAIRAYSSVLQSGDPRYAQTALEYLGVARERHHQFAHAKADYEEFLRRYPKGEAAARVKQRLEGLLTARTAPRGALKAAGKVTPHSQWETFGSLTQFYRRLESKISGVSDTTLDASLDSTFNYTARQRDDTHTFRTDIAASHHKVLGNPDDASSGRLYTLSAEYTQRQGDYSLKAGRQSINMAGIYGRFDGVHLTHGVWERSKLGLTAGYPVDYSVAEGVNSQRRFVGVHLSTASRDKAWNTRLYAVNQTNHGLTDRRAVGLDTRYFRDGNSLYGIVDYDVYFNSLNQATLMSTRQLPNKAALGLTLDYRQSPLLTLNNAIIGQVEDLQGLKALYSEHQLKQLAMDRTTAYRALSLSYSLPLSEKYQLSADLNASHLGGTSASGGVDAIPDQGTEYYFSTQLVANNLFARNDISLAGLRFSNGKTSNTASLNLSSRLPLTPAWRVNPKLAFTRRNNRSGSTQRTLHSSLIIDYRVIKALMFELEGDYDRARTSSASGGDTASTYYLFAGYIYDF
jgi:hypothetical protein